MQTPDGRDFNQANAPRPLGSAARALASAAMVFVRAIAKLWLTTWRLAAALDSALWRAIKLIVRKTINGLAYAGMLGARAFHSLLLWLPTRTGRAYSAASGVFLIVAGLWIADELRAGPRVDDSGQLILQAPLDEEDPILARIEGRYVHLSEIEAAARASGVLRASDILTPQIAFRRGLVESYVEQRLLARAALEDGLQRSPSVLRRINAARDRVLAASFMDSRLRAQVTPKTVEQFYNAQRDVTVLGDEVRARHILVATKQEADAVVGALAGGADFGVLARELSQDRATAPLGGEIGWFTRSIMTRIFSNVAFATTPGEVAAPFETEFGWHVMEVLERRSTKAVPYKEVRGEVEEFLRLYTIDETLAALAKESQVVYFRPPEDEREPDPSSPELGASDFYETDPEGDDTLN
jgi:peptidyl-prolyl cis-trans isomerase C